MGLLADVASRSPPRGSARLHGTDSFATAIDCLFHCGGIVPFIVRLLADTARGTGRYCIGLPLGALFCFKFDLGLPGLWWGLVVGGMFQGAGLSASGRVRLDGSKIVHNYID